MFVSVIMGVITFCSVLVLAAVTILGQGLGTITGVVRNSTSGEPIPGATVRLVDTQRGGITKADGSYTIRDVVPNTYMLKAYMISYDTASVYNVVVTSGNIRNIDIVLDESTDSATVISVKLNVYGKTAETQMSVQNLTSEEIRSNPGGNFDVSRVAQVLPGVGGATGGATFRNDISVRGGGPTENVFYLDGIEIPQINHFATQGSSGGPAGILNVAFIDELVLSSSSFGVRYDNALSSVFNIKQKNGNAERIQGNLRVSATEAAATIDGPLFDGTTVIASARRSYLDLLFTALDLPIRPNYWDFQFKTNTEVAKGTTLTVLGVGAIDDFRFGLPRNSTPEKEFVLRSVPSVRQWNYTLGASLRRSLETGYYTISASRNEFDNRLDRFQDADEGNEDKRLYKLTSRETENKVRAEIVGKSGDVTYNVGAQLQQVSTTSDVFLKVGNASVSSASTIAFMKYGAYGSFSYTPWERWLRITAGVRADANSYTDKGLEAYRTLSPRIALSSTIMEGVTLNASVGRYYKLPSYTVLSYADSTGSLVNGGVGYIGATHYVIGGEYMPQEDIRVTAETFVKIYSDYPVSLQDGISLANKGITFGSVGNEAVQSTGKGRSLGFELCVQKKLTADFFTTVSYTFVKSEFTGSNGKYVPSAWDYNHLLSAIIGYKLGSNWEAGLKYRFAGGSPYTPYDLASSQRLYATRGTGVIDYGQLNSLRLRGFNQADIRIDKKMSFEGWSLDLFIDVQNFLGFSNESAPDYTFKRTADNSDWETTDGQSLRLDGTNGIPVILDNYSKLITPSIGIIAEF